MKTHYQRNLPHLLPPGAIIFFTFRLVDSIATAALQRLVEERELAIQDALCQPLATGRVINIKKQHFAKYDALLDKADYGPMWLRVPAIAEAVAQKIKLLTELEVGILAYCIMSNHVHLVVQLPELPDFSAARMMQRLKGRTALAANKLLGRQGEAFWRHESYDHVVRDGKEQERVVAYVVNNPVKAGLVEDWTQWPYTYVR
jgi:REP element-mobilizing transposase RayT